MNTQPVTQDVALLRARLLTSAEVKTRLASDDAALEAVAAIGATWVEALRAGGTVFFCGNGGSATDAEHLSAELLGRYYIERSALPSYCLSSNTAAMTAIANDYSF